MSEAIAKRKRDDTLIKDDVETIGLDTPFPRGGGSALAPLEIRKAAAEATNDVFDQMVKQKKHKKNKTKTIIPVSSQIKTEPLILSKMKVGTQVLGEVVDIKFTTRELVVSLPNNLTGYCRTDVLSANLIGRFLRFSVAEFGESSKRRLLLSADPESVNSSIEASELVNGLAVQGLVESIEEKGILLDLGETLGKGFVSGKTDKFTVGEPVLGFISNSERRIKTLTLNPKTSVATVMSQASLAPGTLVVSAPEERITPMGCVYNLLGHITASSDAIHSQGEESAVRVLFSYPPLQFNGDRQLGVTRLPHLLNLTSIDAATKTGTVMVGTVKQIRPNLGLFLTLSDGLETIGFAHVSQIRSQSGEKQVDLDTPEFAEGTQHAVRVISVPSIDGTPYLSLDPNVIEQKFMSLEEIAIGDVVKNATVDRIMPKGGVLIRISQGIVGIANELQLSDSLMKNPEQKYKIGQKVAVRVLNVDMERERVELSLKKSVVEFGGEILVSYDRTSEVTIGTVIKILDGGVKLGFFGGIKGFLPASEMSETGAKPSDIMRIGQTVRVHVIEADAARDRLIVSSRPISELGAHVGEILDGRVSSKNKQEARVVLGHQGSLGEATLIGSSKHFKVDQEIKVKVLTDRLVTNDSRLIASDLPTDIDDIEVGQQLTGFVTGVQSSLGVFVGFAAGFVGLVPANIIGSNSWPKLGTVITVNVDTVDLAKNRVFLSLPVKTSTISATITAVKETQLNVVTDDGQQGRVDISEVFKNFDDIENKSKPLSVFRTGQKLDNLSVVGRHDARNHRFLPLSHRTGTHVVLELVMNAASPLVAGEKVLGFVNNYSDDGRSVWVTLSPTLRGQLSLVDLTDNIEELEDPIKHYPVGAALHLTVLRTGSKPALTALQNGPSDLALIFNVDPLRLMVRLPYHKTAAISCVDTGDEFTKLKNTFSNGDIVEFHRVEGRVTLRSQPHLPIEDGQVRSGFVWNIANGGVFVALAPNVIGRVQIGQLSDTYLKDWKSFVKVGDVVEAKILSIGGGKADKIELSLKPSVVTGRKQPNIDNVEIGKNYNGRVRRVESFGVFVDFHGVTGLAHRSNISDRVIDDLSRVFKEGDSVRVRVLDKDTTAGKLSLGMKAKYFENDDTVEADNVSDGESDSAPIEDSSESNESSDLDVDMGDYSQSDANDSLSESEIDADNSKSDSDTSSEDETDGKKHGISAGFDWSGDINQPPAQSGDDSDSESDSDDDEPRQRRRRKREDFVQDETASLQTRLPQSDKDFERLLVANPESSVLWMNYMAFELQLGEIDGARQVARRALSMIPQRDEDERLNIWVALLNLEVQFGSEESATQVFKEAQQFMDSLTIHLRMANVYSQAGKIQKARETYKRAHKRFGGESLEPWLAEMRFLFTDGIDKVAARALADIALQRLPNRLHRDFTRQFALMEFEYGDAERGRTLFEALLAAAPKRVDIWNVYIDQEIKHGDESRFSALFDRVLQQRISMKQAKFFFKKWIDVASDQDYVKLRAQEYVEQREKPDSDEESS